MYITSVFTFLKHQIKVSTDLQEGENEWGWDEQKGILISRKHAETIASFLKPRLTADAIDNLEKINELRRYLLYRVVCYIENKIISGNQDIFWDPNVRIEIPIPMCVFLLDFIDVNTQGYVID